MVDIQTEPRQAPACLQIPLRKQDGSLAGYALIDEQDAQLAGFRWHLGGGGYARRLEKGKWTFMHRVIMQAPAGVEVDHINRNRLDNRRCNLRLADRAGNARNCKRNRRNTSGYKGVHRVGQGGRWAAAIRYEGGTFHLGVCATAEEAAVTYDLAAMALHGEFAATNFSYTEPLPLLGDLRALLLWFAGRRIQWHRRFDRLRDRLRPVEGAIVIVPDGRQSLRLRSETTLRQIAAQAAEVLRVE